MGGRAREVRRGWVGHADVTRRDTLPIQPATRRAILSPRQRLGSSASATTARSTRTALASGARTPRAPPSAALAAARTSPTRRGQVAVPEWRRVSGGWRWARGRRGRPPRLPPSPPRHCPACASRPTLNRVGWVQAYGRLVQASLDADAHKVSIEQSFQRRLGGWVRGEARGGGAWAGAPRCGHRWRRLARLPTRAPPTHPQTQLQLLTLRSVTLVDLRPTEAANTAARAASTGPAGGRLPLGGRGSKSSSSSMVSPGIAVFMAGRGPGRGPGAGAGHRGGRERHFWPAPPHSSTHNAALASVPAVGPCGPAHYTPEPAQPRHGRLALWRRGR